MEEPIKRSTLFSTPANTFTNPPLLFDDGCFLIHSKCEDTMEECIDIEYLNCAKKIWDYQGQEIIVIFVERYLKLVINEDIFGNLIWKFEINHVDRWKCFLNDIYCDYY